MVNSDDDFDQKCLELISEEEEESWTMTKLAKVCHRSYLVEEEDRRKTSSGNLFEATAEHLLFEEEVEHLLFGEEAEDFLFEESAEEFLCWAMVAETFWEEVKENRNLKSLTRHQNCFWAGETELKERPEAFLVGALEGDSLLGEQLRYNACRSDIPGRIVFHPDPRLLIAK